MKSQTIITYDNKELKLIIGEKYGGEGCSGLTDGVEVKGKLTEIDMRFDTVILWSDKLDLPCAVKLRSLYKI